MIASGFFTSPLAITYYHLLLESFYNVIREPKLIMHHIQQFRFRSGRVRW